MAYDSRQLKRINNLKKINIIYQETKEGFLLGKTFVYCRFFEYCKNVDR